MVPDAEESNAPQPLSSLATAEPVGCSFCIGSGMEVVQGKGARLEDYIYEGRVPTLDGDSLTQFI